jgi:hypothetical protein
MAQVVTLACLALCPSTSHFDDLQRVNEEWQTHRAAAMAPAFRSPYRGMGDDVDQWLPLVAGHFGDLGPEAVETVLCLMALESGGNPNARHPRSGASGLMQVLPSWAPKFGVSRDDLFTPEINLYISRRLYDDGGFGHWSPYQRGECR